MKSRSWRALIAALAVLAVACTGGETTQPQAQTASEDDKPAVVKRRKGDPDSNKPAQLPPARPKLSRVTLKTQRVAKLDQPTAIAMREGDDSIYVADREGLIQAVRGGKVETLLDWTENTKGGNEQGMLGLTFSPDGAHLYVYYIGQPDEHSHLDQYTMDGDRLDLDSRREVLLVKQPEDNVHKGGRLAFGDDGMLYLALGDGGPSDVPPMRSQEMDLLHGKLIRILPTPDAPDPYTIPEDNPFVGDRGARGEIFALGLRNPWRFSFDRETGDLWLGDVGRYIIEEINFRPADKIAGTNFGWPFFEGSSEMMTGAPADVIGPLHEYPHEDRCAVIGGYVYRGTVIEDLRGAYVYGDFCDGKIRGLVRKGGTVKQEAELGPQLTGMTSVEQGLDGELYVLALEQGLFKLVP